MRKYGLGDIFSDNITCIITTYVHVLWVEIMIGASLLTKYMLTWPTSKLKDKTA